LLERNGCRGAIDSALTALGIAPENVEVEDATRRRSDDRKTDMRHIAIGLSLR
jgi:hypothetical protein